LRLIRPASGRLLTMAAVARVLGVAIGMQGGGGEEQGADEQ
jgi:hypothetical protein